MVEVDATALTEYATSNDLIPVIILESVQAAPCKTEVLNANVYKVKIFKTEDTVYVFEICQKMLWNGSSKSQEEGAFVVKPSSSSPVKFFIPSSTSVPKGSLFIFGSINRLEY